jgi:ABC-type glycerol-3-phosphate transport system substrate-binding protein
VGVTHPPASWEELNEAVEKITTVGENDAIVRSGVAMGTARNINRSTDILSLLLMQSGVAISDRESGEVDFSKEVDRKDLGQVALEYYTDFANPTKRVYTWSNFSPYSIDAFQQGTTAMMFNYAHQTPVLRAKAPRLNFGVAAMPQLNSDRPVNYANYWAVTVSKFSKAPTSAWQFLTYLTSFEGIIPYLNSTQHPAARRDLIDQQKEDLDIGTFAKQVLTAQSWKQVDSVAIESILANLIEDVNYRRKSISEALIAAENQINVLVRKK